MSVNPQDVSRRMRSLRSRFRIIVLQCGLAGLWMFSMQVAHAATLIVNTTADLPGTSCALPCSLRQAIGAANSAGGNNVITFAVDGIFTLTTGNDLHITGSTSQTLSIIGNGPSETVVDGGGMTRGFEIDLGATVSMSGLSIKNCNAGPSANGGGILNSGTLVFVDGSILGNRAGRGGGISNSGGAVLSVTNGFITGNSADVGGGGIRSGIGSTLTVTNSTISGNSTEGVGGGIVSAGNCTMMITNSTISENSATGAGGGGGIATQGQAIVVNSAITGNTAVDHGGGIAIGGAIGAVPGMLTLRNSLVSNNTVTGAGKGKDGGGINNGSMLVVDHSSVVDNVSAHDGGGIANEGGAVATITNSTILGNSADHDGGGITNELAGSPLNSVTLTNSFVTGNRAGHRGGGVFNAIGTVTLNRTTVADNIPDNCSPTSSVSGCSD